MTAHPTRRAVLVAKAMTILWHPAGWAQETSRTYRLGILSGGETREAPSWSVFFDEMGKEGFVEGRNLIVDWRFVGSPDQTGRAAAELVQLAPDVLIPGGSTPAITAAQQATRTIPMVGTADDMLGSGLVPSLARPGGNLTGISFMATELDGKRLEILMELVPASRHMAALADPAVTGKPQLDALRSSAAAGRGQARSGFGATLSQIPTNVANHPLLPISARYRMDRFRPRAVVHGFALVMAWGIAEIIAHRERPRRERRPRA